MVRLAITLFLLQCGYHAFTASMPVALTGAGVSDPTIGLIVGSAAAVQVPAAFLAGALLDRFGGVRILYAGAIAYLLGSLIVLAPVTEPGDSTLPFFAARIFQGIGLPAPCRLPCHSSPTSCPACGAALDWRSSTAPTT